MSYFVAYMYDFVAYFIDFDDVLLFSEINKTAYLRDLT